MEKHTNITVEFSGNDIIVESLEDDDCFEVLSFSNVAAFVDWFKCHSEEENPMRSIWESPQWDVRERMMIDCDWITRIQPEPEVEAKKFEKVEKFEVDGPTIKPFDLAPLKREGIREKLEVFSNLQSEVISGDASAALCGSVEPLISPAEAEPEPAPEPEPDPIAIAGMLIHRFKGAS